jgi:hypothetical protein
MIMYAALMGFHNADSVNHLFHQEGKNVLGNIISRCKYQSCENIPYFIDIS